MRSVRPYAVYKPYLSAEANPEADYLGPIRRFAEEHFVRLARSVIHQMQRMPTSGIFEDQTKGMKSFWDEWCWYQAKYDNDVYGMSAGFEETLDAIVRGAVEDLKEAEAVLLTIAADEEAEGAPRRKDETILQVLRDMVTDAASERNMNRFEVY